MTARLMGVTGWCFLSCLLALACSDGVKRSSDNVASDEVALSEGRGSDEARYIRKRTDHLRCDHRGHGHMHCEKADAAADTSDDVRMDAVADTSDDVRMDAVADTSDDVRIDAAADSSDGTSVDVADDVPTDSQPSDVPGLETGPVDAGTPDADASQVDAVPSCGGLDQPCCPGDPSICPPGRGLICDATNHCVPCGQLGLRCCQDPGGATCRGLGVTCNNATQCVSCGQIGQPCCRLSRGGPVLTLCPGDEAGGGTLGPFSVCDVPADPLADPQCTICGGLGGPCCRFNHGTTWQGGCSGGGGIRGSCQLIDGRNRCAGCGLEGQPCCSAASSGGACLGGLLCSPSVPGGPGPLACRIL